MSRLNAQVLLNPRLQIHLLIYHEELSIADSFKDRNRFESLERTFNDAKSAITLRTS